jgi:hypothetical protein
VPVLEDFPLTIADEADTPLSCSIPPRFDPNLPAAVDEAVGLRPAYERQRKQSGRTNVGNVVGADGIRELVASFVRLADGVHVDDAGFPGPARAGALDVRAYYEEAAIALAGHSPAARQAETWFFKETETGRVLRRAQQALRDSGAAYADWFPIVPQTQRDDN